MKVITEILQDHLSGGPGHWGKLYDDLLPAIESHTQAHTEALREIIEEADVILSALEDMHHGAIGNDITKLRHKIQDVV